jgi:hypothetical protein
MLLPQSCLLVKGFIMSTVPQSIQRSFQSHQARLAAVAEAPGAAELSSSLREISATYLAKEIQALLKAKYASDCAVGTNPKDKIEILATSVATLARQVLPLAPNDAFYEAFTIANVAAAQEVFISIFAPASSGKY